MNQTLDDGSTAACSASLTAPRTKKNGQLKRSVSRIPPNQKRLLDDADCWIGNIREKGLGATFVPTSVLEEVRSNALKSASTALYTATIGRPLSAPPSADKTPAKTAETTRKTSRKSSARHPPTAAETPTTQLSRTENPTPHKPSPQNPVVSLPSKVAAKPGLLEKKVPVSLQMGPPQPPKQNSSNREEANRSQDSARPYSPSWASQADTSDVEAGDSPTLVRQAQQSGTITPKQASAPSGIPVPNQLRSSSPLEDLDVEVPDALGEKSLRTQTSAERPSQQLSQTQAGQRIKSDSPLQSKQRLRRSLDSALNSSPPPNGLISGTYDSTSHHEAQLPEHKQEAPQNLQLERRRRLMKEPKFPELGYHTEAAISIRPESKDYGSAKGRPRSTDTRSKAYVTSRALQHEKPRHRFSDRIDDIAITRPNNPADEDGNAVRAATAPKERLAEIGYTWKLPYETFKATYPDFRGDLEDFLRACYCIQGFANTGSLASFLYDDVIRAFVDFIGYVQAVTSGKPMNLLEWYNRNVDTLQYSKKVVTTENVTYILAAYPKQVDVIRKIIHSSQEPDNVRRDAVASLKLAHDGASAAARVVSNGLMGGVAGPELSLSSTTLARLAESGSIGDSLWPHGQLSSPHLHSTLYGHSLLSDASSKDQSQGRIQSQQESQLNHHSQISSSGLDVTESPLALPSSLVPTAAIPPGMDRVSYMLQSPAQHSSAVEATSSRFPIEIHSRENSEDSAGESAMRRPARDLLAEPVRYAPAEKIASRKRRREEDGPADHAQANKRHTSGAPSNGALAKKAEREQHEQQESDDGCFEPPRSSPRTGKAVSLAIPPRPADTEQRRATIATSNRQATEDNAKGSSSLLKIAAPLPKTQRQSMQPLPGSATEMSRRFGEFLKARAKKVPGQKKRSY